MSQSDEPVDPYLPPGRQDPGPQQPGPQQPDPRGPGQQYPGGYPEPSYTSGGYQGAYQGGWADGQPAPYPGGVGHGPEAEQQLRDSKPPAVRTLLQVMVAGGVVSALIGAAGLIGIDQVVADTAAELDQVAAESGMEPFGASSALLESAAVGAVVVSTLVSTGLWLLFAWLFSRGRARVLGTVLGALNGVGSLFGLFGSLAPLDLALNLVHLGLVVAGLVLLWRPEATAWFRAVGQARTQAPWR